MSKSVDGYVLDLNYESTYFKDMAKSLAAAKCHFVTSSRPLTQLTVGMPEDLQKLMGQEHDLGMCEFLRDFAFNTSFRCDVFTKGRNVLAGDEFIESLNGLSLVLMCAPEDFTYKVRTPLVEVACKKELYEPLLNYLAENGYAPKTVKRIRELDAYKELPLSSLIELLLVLLGVSIIHPSQEYSEKQKEQCRNLNTSRCRQSADGHAAAFLASPVIGGGVYVSQIEQAFLYAISQGHGEKEQYLEFVSNKFLENKQSIILEGKKLSEPDSKKHLAKLATNFAEKRLPLLKALMVTI